MALGVSSHTDAANTVAEGYLRAFVSDAKEGLKPFFKTEFYASFLTAYKYHSHKR